MKILDRHNSVLAFTRSADGKCGSVCQLYSHLSTRHCKSTQILNYQCLIFEVTYNSCLKICQKHNKAFYGIKKLMQQGQISLQQFRSCFNAYISIHIRSIHLACIKLVYCQTYTFKILAIIMCILFIWLKNAYGNICTFVCLSLIHM